MSEQTPAPDAVTPLYGAPVVDEDPAITVVASWHNAPPTGEVEAPPVQEVRAWEENEDGTVVAKVLAPPARPTAKAGPKAEAKTEPKTKG